MIKSELLPACLLEGVEEAKVFGMNDAREAGRIDDKVGQTQWGEVGDKNKEFFMTNYVDCSTEKSRRRKYMLTHNK